MKLKVFERLVLLNILPAEGDFVTLKLVRKLRESLSFNEREIEEIDFKNHWRCPQCNKIEVSVLTIKCQDCGISMQPAGQVTWNEEKAEKVIKDIHMGERMSALCKSTLQKLNDEKKLVENHMSLFEKFCVTGDEEEDEK